MFTLHEFIIDYCHNKPEELQEKISLLIQAIVANKLISRYNSLLQQRLKILQAYVQDFNLIPGMNIQTNEYIGMDAKGIFLHILIALLSIPPEVDDDENLLDSNKQIAIFTKLPISYARFEIIIDNSSKNLPYYYSNLYHLILYWVYHIYEEDVHAVGHVYNFYYDHLIMEKSMIYRLYQRFQDIDFILAVNYLAENPTYIDITKTITIDAQFVLDLLQPYKINTKILLQRKFYNFHSYFPYILKLYNSNLKIESLNLDHARFNYLIKLDWVQRRPSICRTYEIIKVSENESWSPQTNEKNQPSQRQLLQKIILADSGKLVVDGPVLGFWHIAKYGLIVHKDIAELLLQSAYTAFNVNSRYRDILYQVILLKMGYNLSLVIPLILQQAWASILTGIKITWPELNLGYSYKINYKFKRIRLKEDVNKFLNRIEVYNTHGVKRSILSRAGIISTYNIPTYSDIVIDSVDNKAILYRHSSTMDMIENNIVDIYPTLDDKDLMINWFMDEHSGLLINGLPKLSYMDYTKSTEELAYKHNIAYIYSRSITLYIIEQQQKQEEAIYYRRPEHKLGDGKVVNSRTSSEVIINKANAIAIMNAWEEDYMSAWFALLISTGLSSPAVESTINFITIAHALNLFDQPKQNLLLDTSWNYVIVNADKVE